MSALRRVLLVEGPEDRALVHQLCNAHHLDNRAHFEVVVPDPAGVEGLLADLRLRARTGLTALGVIVDADTDPAARWAGVTAALASAGYTDLPPTLPTGGLLLPAVSARSRIGVWMMPDNRSSGAVEDFARSLVSEEDPLLPLAQRAVADLPLMLRRFAPSKRAKAELHTWLAWQEEPGTPLGLAVTRRYLARDAALARAFMRWMRSLFEVSDTEAA